MHKFVLTLALLGWAIPLSAQVVVLPSSTVKFPANPAHATVVSGLNVVDSYTLKIMPQGSTTVVFGPRDVGKPTPDGSSTITVPIGWTAAQLDALATGAYVATISAVGPGGTTESSASAPFVVLTSPPPQGAPVVVR